MAFLGKEESKTGRDLSDGGHHYTGPRLAELGGWERLSFKFHSPSLRLRVRMRVTQGRRVPCRVRERVAVNSALLRFVFSEVTGRGEWEPTAVLVNSCGFKRFADTLIYPPPLNSLTLTRPV